MCAWLYFLCIGPHKSLGTSLKAQQDPGNFPGRVLGSDPTDQHGTRPPQVQTHGSARFQMKMNYCYLNYGLSSIFLQQLIETEGVMDLQCLSSRIISTPSFCWHGQHISGSVIIFRCVLLAYLANSSMFRLDTASQIQITYLNPLNVNHCIRKYHVPFHAGANVLSFTLKPFWRHHS